MWVTWELAAGIWSRDSLVERGPFICRVWHELQVDSTQTALNWTPSWCQSIGELERKTTPICCQEWWQKYHTLPDSLPQSLHPKYHLPLTVFLGSPECSKKPMNPKSNTGAKLWNCPFLLSSSPPTTTRNVCILCPVPFHVYAFDHLERLSSFSINLKSSSNGLEVLKSYHIPPPNVIFPYFGTINLHLSLFNALRTCHFLSCIRVFWCSSFIFPTKS